MDSTRKSKRIGQLAKLDKGKEVITAAREESCEGDKVLDSKDTISSRTSRGRTQLDKITKQRMQGIRNEVSFNNFGQPIGPAAVAMQSYIGVLARQKVNIKYKTWKQVPIAVKELIWESVNVSKLACFNNYNISLLMIDIFYVCLN